MKICIECKVEQPLENFYRAYNTPNARRSRCKPCHVAVTQKWMKKNRERVRRYYRKYIKIAGSTLNKKRRRNQAAYKDRVFSHYGKVCACCAESIFEFLTIDHVNNDGAAHRKTTKRAGSGLYHWLLSRGFPVGFQTLCRNCNWGKHVNGGICPHKGKK